MPLSSSPESPAPAGPPPEMEQAFRAARAELNIRIAFPPDVLAEAETAARRTPTAGPERVDHTAVPFVTIDPPGSRDLDQALHLERAASGIRLRYAIADVGFWVDRGGAIEREAWLRGVTFYAPDEREPLYPPTLGEDAASLLPDADKPAVVFTFDLDARGEITASTVERALVRSRAQLTYAQTRDQIRSGGKLFSAESWGESLLLLREFGELRDARERDRGGVSLPILDQHVTKVAAARLGYILAYEAPNEAEDWNAQVSLLTGHAAALRMLAAQVGILRTMPPPQPAALERFRTGARALGFRWPREMSYAAFLHGVDPTQPRTPTLLWQARRTSSGADYVAFSDAPPENTLHAALAMPYAHVTAPLRRLADRYVLDLLVTLERGARPTAAELDTLFRLPPLMNEAETKDSRLERRAVDLAEAYTLHGCEGKTFAAVVLGARGGGLEVQIEEPPIRATVPKPAGGGHYDLGAEVRLRLDAVDLQAGVLAFEIIG